MFIYSNWNDFCKRLIALHVPLITANEILEYKDHYAKWIVVKHDVETNVKKALKLAKIEAKYGIRATYFVQEYLLADNIKILNKIKDLGHEVTYHYDVLDANNGNMIKAASEFSKNIECFLSHGFDVKTICPHGNPLMIRDGWSSNKDLFRDKEVAEKHPEILDIVVQLPSILNNELLYISDAGYTWKKISNISNNDIKNKGDILLSSYDELLKVVNDSNHVIISTHPHRWERFRLKLVFNKSLFIVLRSSARTLSKIGFLKKIISKFYYLAKKI